MKEKPMDNRIFTGNDQEFSAEQVGNLLKSKEFSQHQKAKIDHMLATSVLPQVQAKEQSRQMLLSFELIRDTKDGDLLISIMRCLTGGYSHKKVAKVLMKSEKDAVPAFQSLTKAIAFVKEREKEAVYRVKCALSKKILIPGGV